MKVHMKRTLSTLALAVSALSSAQAAELFVNIQSSGAMAQGAGLVLATQALEQKASVRLLLCDAAADIAVTGQHLPMLKPRNVTAQQMLQGRLKSLPQRFAGVLEKGREEVLDHLRQAPVQTLPEALAYSGTVGYLNTRDELHERLSAQGLSVLDTLPSELGPALVTRYLGWKKAGAF